MSGFEEDRMRVLQLFGWYKRSTLIHVNHYYATSYTLHDSKREHMPFPERERI